MAEQKGIRFSVPNKMYFKIFLQVEQWVWQSFQVVGITTPPAHLVQHYTQLLVFYTCFFSLPILPRDDLNSIY